MNVELRSDYPLTDEACKQATGQTLGHWIGAIEARTELRGKRREAVNEWLYPEMGKNLWWATTAWVEFERKEGIYQKDGRVEGFNICVTKKVALPVEQVFAAWTSAAVANWFGDDAKADAEGSIKDSKGNNATATRIRTNKDLRYQWASPDGTPTQVDVTFADEKGKTQITLTHQRIQTRDEADGLRRGWGEAFDRLKTLLE